MSSKTDCSESHKSNLWFICFVFGPTLLLGDQIFDPRCSVSSWVGPEACHINPQSPLEWIYNMTSYSDRKYINWPNIRMSKSLWRGVNNCAEAKFFRSIRWGKRYKTPPIWCLWKNWRNHLPWRCKLFHEVLENHFYAILRYDTVVLITRQCSEEVHHNGWSMEDRGH